ncbi:MAG: carboxypeptidase-like regulatory domain-containing protein [Bacteroidia bacterium]
MQKLFFLLLGFLFLISETTFAQDAKLTGKVLDNTGQPAPYAAVMLMQGETVINGAYTDDNGVYSIQPIVAGVYDLKVQVLDVIEVLTGIVIKAGETKVVDVKFSKKTEATIEEVLITEFKRPVFAKEARSGSVVNGEEFQKMGTRNIQKVQAITTGVYSGDKNKGEIAIK